MTFGQTGDFGVRYTLFRRDPRLTKRNRYIGKLSVGRGNNSCRRGVFDIVLSDTFTGLTELEKIRLLESAAQGGGISVGYWKDGRTYLSGVPDPPPPRPLPPCIYVPPSEVKARAQARAALGQRSSSILVTPETSPSTTPETSQPGRRKTGAADD